MYIRCIYVISIEIRDFAVVEIVQRECSWRRFSDAVYFCKIFLVLFIPDIRFLITGRVTRCMRPFSQARIFGCFTLEANNAKSNLRRDNRILATLTLRSNRLRTVAYLLMEWNIKIKILRYHETSVIHKYIDMYRYKFLIYPLYQIRINIFTFKYFVK